MTQRKPVSKKEEGEEAAAAAATRQLAPKSDNMIYAFLWRNLHMSNVGLEANSKLYYVIKLS